MVVELGAGELDRVHERIAGRFGRAEPRARVREYLCGLVAGLERKNGWTLAEWAGDNTPWPRAAKATGIAQPATTAA
jgi:hypothetical protein